MKTRQTLVAVLVLAGGVWFLLQAVLLLLQDDLTIGLLTGAAGIGLLVVACQDLIRLRKP